MVLDQYIKEKVDEMGSNDLETLRKYVEKRINELSTFDEEHFEQYLSTLSQECLEGMLDTVNLMTRKKHTPTGVLTREYEPFEKFLNACSEEQLVMVEMCIDGTLDDCDGPPYDTERDETDEPESDSDNEFED